MDFEGETGKHLYGDEVVKHLLKYRPRKQEGWKSNLEMDIWKRNAGKDNLDDIQPLKTSHGYHRQPPHQGRMASDDIK